ncbi:transcription factor MYBS3-like [Zingiber officinale]|uniref:transcription factor MYBS3-like n=1 Tax=Zingiber officinale TaxID=94328 RepID=UPI001C4D6888|nr:transcription factor MYBS3-like [Zingiber officinale]XP_042462307.1 transcription factor MYBS3-like [Zingiber officinale]
MRRCSHCSHNGHNSRTCPSRGGVKLFGVRLTDGSIQKSASMGNLSLLSGSSGGASPADGPEPAAGAATDGYASEDFVKGSSASCRERKRGNPWTEEEHRMFLLGLQKLGKGDWRGISRSYVVSRTPTQVASHAQKYFIRKSNITRRKRRSSLFDMEADEPLEPQAFSISQESDAQNSKPPPIPPILNEEDESMDSKVEVIEEVPQPEAQLLTYPVMFPAYFSPVLQFPSSYWSECKANTLEQQTHEIIKPTAVHSKTPINVDELVGMSKLSIGESLVGTTSSLDFLRGSKRQSAFHANCSMRSQT